MIRISANFQPHFKEMHSVAESSIRSALEIARQVWVAEAKKRLHSTTQSYINGIYTDVRVDSRGVHGSIGLRGTWANKLENGFASYDMKPIYDHSSKKKIGEDGQWYLHIPFRHHTPQANKSSSMSSEIYTQARKLPKWGKMTTKDTTSVYNGLTKVPQGDKKNSYMTWRTVGENSPPSAWMHPGFKGVHIERDLKTHIEDILMQVFKTDSGYKY